MKIPQHKLEEWEMQYTDWTDENLRQQCLQWVIETVEIDDSLDSNEQTNVYIRTSEKFFNYIKNGNVDDFILTAETAKNLGEKELSDIFDQHIGDISILEISLLKKD